MSSRRSVRQLLVAVILGVLVGGGLMAVTPAGAEVSNAVATNWKKIWKKNLKPLADRRYYTKAQSDTKYATKAESAASAAAAQAGATSAANAATDTKLADYYKKADSDARYVPKPVVQRGMYGMVYDAQANGDWGTAQINFAQPLAAAPTVHFIKSGDPVPANCSGTAAAPNAAPGHLCIFERYVLNRTFINAYASSGAPGADATGTFLGFTAVGAGSVSSAGTWALGVSGLASTSARVSPAPSSSTSGASAGVTR